MGPVSERRSATYASRLVLYLGLMSIHCFLHYCTTIITLLICIKYRTQYAVIGPSRGTIFRILSRGTIFRSPVQGRTSTARPGTCVDSHSLSTARGDVQCVQPRHVSLLKKRAHPPPWTISEIALSAPLLGGVHLAGRNSLLVTLLRRPVRHPRPLARDRAQSWPATS